VFFPDISAQPHESSESEQESPWIYLMIIVGLILAFFAFTVSIIIRQKRLSEVKTDFINNMTHELKTPISTIGLSSEMLLREDFSNDAERLKRYAGLIYKENKRLEHQVERVLNIAKLNKNELSLKKTTLHLHELIEEAADSFRFNQLQSGGEIRLDLQADPDDISGDQVHITNVIFNLIDNAVKYSKDKPEVSVSSTNDKRGVLLTFSDKGIGIRKEDIKLIFDKFYRVSTGNVHDVKGFGLGLYYVKLVVDGHGGTIHVKSQPDEGTTFTLWLPRK
jgi:two-component system phosphate regulon sensor histidine kinase PhoR